MGKGVKQLDICLKQEFNRSSFYLFVPKWISFFNITTCHFRKLYISLWTKEEAKLKPP